jgi:hypothetical protein
MLLRRLLNADVAIATIMLALGGYWLIAAIPYGLWRGTTPATGFLPFWYGVLLVLLAGAILVQRVRQGADEAGDPIDSPRKPLIILLVVIAAVLGLETVGFVTSIFLTMLILFVVVEKLPLVPAAVVSAAVTAVLYFMFGKWLGVPLPAGLLGA